MRRLKAPASGDLAALLERLLGSHVSLDPLATTTFADAYVTRFGPASMGIYARQSLGGLCQAAPLRNLLPASRRDKMEVFERRMVSYFLRSTDYFRVSQGTPARFVAFADPYEVGCSNPLAQLSLDDS